MPVSAAALPSGTAWQGPEAPRPWPARARGQARRLGRSQGRRLASVCRCVAVCRHTRPAGRLAIGTTRTPIAALAEFTSKDRGLHAPGVPGMPGGAIPNSSLRTVTLSANRLGALRRKHPGHPGHPESSDSSAIPEACASKLSTPDALFTSRLASCTSARDRVFPRPRRTFGPPRCGPSGREGRAPESWRQGRTLVSCV